MPLSSLRFLLRALLLAVLLVSLGCDSRRRGGGGGGGGGGDDDDSANTDDDDDIVGDDDDTSSDDDDTSSDDDDTSSDDDDTSTDDDDTASDDDDTSSDDDDTFSDDDDSTSAPDWDGDGWSPPQDCDDYEPNTHPGAPELCDDEDNDCNGAFGPDEVDWDYDNVMLCEGDCDDTDSNTYPFAPELCDGEDNDCNGSLGSDESDYDGDGYAVCDGDCNDFSYGVNPGALETCEDGIDQDCDGMDDPCSSGSCEFSTEVDYGGRCYYLDGSGGSCEFGYELAPQSILNSIASSFVGKQHKYTVADNCCIWHANQGTEDQDWGMTGNDCNASGAFVTGPQLGGSSCTNALNTYPLQLTLCQSY